MNLFMYVVEQNPNEEVPKIAGTFLRTYVIGACNKLKINVKDW